MNTGKIVVEEARKTEGGIWTCLVFEAGLQIGSVQAHNKQLAELLANSLVSGLNLTRRAPLMDWEGLLDKYNSIVTIIGEKPSEVPQEISVNATPIVKLGEDLEEVLEVPEIIGLEVRVFKLHGEVRRIKIMGSMYWFLTNTTEEYAEAPDKLRRIFSEGYDSVIKLINNNYCQMFKLKQDAIINNQQFKAGTAVYSLGSFEGSGDYRVPGFFAGRSIKWRCSSFGILDELVENVDYGRFLTVEACEVFAKDNILLNSNF